MVVSVTDPFFCDLCMCSFVDVIYPLVYTAEEILGSYITIHGESRAFFYSIIKLA